MRIRQHGAKLFFGFYLAPFFFVAHRPRPSRRSRFRGRQQKRLPPPPLPAPPAPLACPRTARPAPRATSARPARFPGRASTAGGATTAPPAPRRRLHAPCSCRPAAPGARCKCRGEPSLWKLRPAVGTAFGISAERRQVGCSATAAVGSKTDGTGEKKKKKQQ